MAKFEFPRNPGSKPDNLFADETGQNPFGEQAGEHVESAAAANPFSSPVGDASFEVTDYESQLADRSGQVFAFGLIGLLLSLAGLLASVLFAAAQSWGWGLFYALPVQCVSLAVALPAWMMGKYDVRAIAQHAMDGTGRSRTSSGLRMGQIAVVISLLPVTFLGLIVLQQLFAA